MAVYDEHDDRFDRRECLEMAIDVLKANGNGVIHAKDYEITALANFFYLFITGKLYKNASNTTESQPVPDESVPESSASS